MTDRRTLKTRVRGYLDQRRLGRGRRQAFVSAFVPIRILVANAALHGHPVAYRIEIVGTLHLAGPSAFGAVLADVRMSQSEGPSDDR